MISALKADQALDGHPLLASDAYTIMIVVTVNIALAGSSTQILSRMVSVTLMQP
jgi:hypothetical protein